jgi:heptosyltransferase III
VNVLLVRAGALGDVLLLRRAAFALRRAGHSVSLLAPARPGAALVGAGPSEVDRLWAWDGPEMAAFLAGETSQSALLSALRAADIVLAYSRSEPVLLALRASARCLLVHDPAPPSTGPHASRWLCEPLRELGLADFDDPPPLAFSDAERATAAPLLAQLPPLFLAIHPGSGSPAKNWPAERFAALGGRLVGAEPALLALGPTEEAWPWRSAVPGTRCVVARNLPVRALAAVLSRAGLFVGNDSGASHLAAAAGAPTLALFGPTDPFQWAPAERSARWLRAPLADLTQLEVDSVVARCEPLLRQARESSELG